MAHDLDVNHICSKVSAGDTVSIGVDSIRSNNKIIYNLSVIIRVQGNRASLIWTKDIEDDIVDDVYRDMYELNLLTSLYRELYNSIKTNPTNFSVKIHKQWFNRYKYEQRTHKLIIDNL